jgi:O-antigen/teichoic acid export membrane protein
VRLVPQGTIVSNAASLVGATAATSGLGYLFWGVAARRFPTAAVGSASAAVSAMMLLGTLGMLGLGTLLIRELPHRRGREAPLLAAVLVVSGAAGFGLGALWALLAPLVSPELGSVFPGGSRGAEVAFFAVGVGLTSVVLVLDQALLGLLRGDLQFGRNVAFGASKLGLLVLAGLGLAGGPGRQGWTIYGVWLVGNVVSLAFLAVVAFRRVQTRAAGVPRPEWGALRGLGRAAVGHHLLNLSLQTSHLALPLLVTALLSATANAYFYVAWMVGGFVFIIPVALTMAVFAVGARDPEALAPKLRFTLGLAFGLGLLATVVLVVGARPLLSLFGPAYADQAASCLRILACGVFPLILKDHFVAVCRVEGRLGRAALVAAGGAGLELGAAAAGALAGGLPGLSLGWVAALCLEGVVLVFPVGRSAGWWTATRTPPAWAT